ncbi:hypothetical protein EV421DRAFT_550850 [Armillaria borealis]|uniref:DUF6535 domain-containing protein n=3 Tax=Armillaria TaxID=47424 RepID=A0AA39JHH0_9AGAR|nr:hypothetical protein EV421DRAFT_550850 [Armillaria borealis]
MSIHEVDRTMTLDPGQDGAIVREHSEAESRGSWGNREQQRNLPERVELDEVVGRQEQDEALAAAPPSSATASNVKTIFGLKRSNTTVNKGYDTYNYEQKYPEDAIYEETAQTARVWRTYEDESRNHDANMVEESRDNVDVLLVFAGLFSAVVTTFVAQTSQSLQPDYAAMSASLLYESVLIQRAIANGSSVNSITPSPLNPSITFVPAITDVWVNGLWFTSLFLSLTTALVAVLVKQWLHHYVALPSGTPRDRSFTRQFRYAGFQKWHVRVIIGLLPVLMHLALAIFLSGLVIFLHPLRVAMSWIMCAATAIVYAVYVLAAILPLIYPQCPYRTPLCDLAYDFFCRITPRVSWDNKECFLIACREGKLGYMFRYLPHVQARDPQSLTMIESKFVKQTSTDLAAEALQWLFSVSSNPTVQSVVIQSVGGLPMASEEKLLALRGNNTAMDSLQDSLLSDCLQTKEGNDEPVPGMELKAGRLLRFYPRNDGSYSFIATPDIDSFELTIPILSNGYLLFNRESRESVHPGAFFSDTTTRSLKLPPRCWYHLLVNLADDLDPLDPDNDHHTNTFPLELCFAILRSFDAPPKGLMQDFNSPLVLGFNDAVPYFIDKIYDRVLSIFSNFVMDPSFNEPSLPQSLRVFVVALKFVLHRLSLPEPDVSHASNVWSLFAVLGWIRSQTFSSQEAAAVITVLEELLVYCVVPPLNIEPDRNELFHYTIQAYQSLATIVPSACSLRGLQSVVDFMTINWDQTQGDSYQSGTACSLLTYLLTKRIPVAFTVFLEKQCLQFLENHTFHEASVPMVREYTAGISVMQHGSNGAVDTATHVDYLHNPHNLFTACSILATHGIGRIEPTAIYKDITTLVQLCPTRDAAWDECHRKLRDLAQSDGGDFFGEQRVWSVSDEEFRQLQTDEIRVEKDNIRHAIHVIDDFLDGGGAHIRMGRIHRFLGRCLGRKPDGRTDQEQQV